MGSYLSRGRLSTPEHPREVNCEELPYLYSETEEGRVYYPGCDDEELDVIFCGEKVYHSSFVPLEKLGEVKRMGERLSHPRIWTVYLPEDVKERNPELQIEWDIPTRKYFVRDPRSEGGSIRKSLEDFCREGGNCGKFFHPDDALALNPLRSAFTKRQCLYPRYLPPFPPDWTIEYLIFRYSEFKAPLLSAAARLFSSRLPGEREEVAFCFVDSGKILCSQLPLLPGVETLIIVDVDMGIATVLDFRRKIIVTFDPEVPEFYLPKNLEKILLSVSRKNSLAEADIGEYLSSFSFSKPKHVPYFSLYRDYELRSLWAIFFGCQVFFCYQEFRSLSSEEAEVYSTSFLADIAERGSGEKEIITFFLMLLFALHDNGGVLEPELEKVAGKRPGLTSENLPMYILEEVFEENFLERIESAYRKQFFQDHRQDVKRTDE